MKLGSLFSGYGGLDMAVAQHYRATVIWHCETDKACNRILAERFPGIPNLGDITNVDWRNVERPDIIAGGYPCQPFSVAGAKLGSRDERHLWPWFATAIRVLRPDIVVLENVAGHLRLGFDGVLGDLASMGFDAEWGVVRASDAGAPHNRERLFAVAHARSR